MSDSQNNNTGNATPEHVVIRPTPRARSRKGWLIGSAVAAVGLVAFGAVAISQPFGGFGPHGMGPRHHMMGGMFDPVRAAERIDYGADIILGRVGANDEQKRKIADLIKGNLKDIPALREQHQAARARVQELLKAEKFDKAELEKLRAQQIATAEQISKRIVQSVGEASDILSPKQRQELISLWEKRPGWR